MASATTVLIAIVAAFLLAPGLLISVMPGPNKKWFLGGQVTWLNAAIHAVLIGSIVYFFGE
jgi:hypothetical protein